MKQLLSDAVDDYMVLRGSQDYSKRTLTNEAGVLRRFLTVNGNVWTTSIAQRHVIRYFEEAGRTRRASTLHMDHTVLGQFFEWMRKSKRMSNDCDPMMGRRRPKVTQRERDRVHVSKFPHLLDIAGTDDPRDRAIVAVFLYTLVRDQECADLRLGDVDLEGGWLQVRISKSGIEDRMPICSELDRELRRWLTHYHSSVPGWKLGPNSYLLPRRQSVGIIRSGNGGKIEGHEMMYSPTQPIFRPGRVVSPILEAAGFPVTDHAGRKKWEGSHTLRRSGARALFDRLSADSYDHSLRLVQSMLHHSSVTVTERYIGVTADRRSRDDILRGKEMYATSAENVVRLSV